MVDIRKLVVELIGTFIFVLTIGLTVVAVDAVNGAIAPLAIGASLMVMVYAGGHISGGHYNPAVTLAVWIRGRIATGDVIPYWIAQVLGAVLAGLLTVYLKGNPTIVIKDPDTTRSIVVEIIYMFVLAYTVLNVATSKATAGNSYYGLAIGFAVVIGAFAGGPISGGAFNPAIATGLGTMGIAKWPHVVVLVLSNLVGGTIAGLLFRFLNPHDLEPLEPAPASPAEPAHRPGRRRAGR